MGWGRTDLHLGEKKRELTHMSIHPPWLVLTKHWSMALCKPSLEDKQGLHTFLVGNGK